LQGFSNTPLEHTTRLDVYKLGKLAAMSSRIFRPIAYGHELY